MRRATLALILGLTFASLVLPQPQAGANEAQQETQQGDPWIWWKWANILILAGGLGYLIRKHAPAMFQARSQEIQQALAEGVKVAKDAERHAATIELRLNNLESEIAQLRQSARAETAAEGERIRHETGHHLQRIQQQALQEIDLMTRGAREDLRKYSAELAVGLAEQRIRSRITPELQQTLVDGFVNDLRSRAAEAVRA